MKILQKVHKKMELIDEFSLVQKFLRSMQTMSLQWLMENVCYEKAVYNEYQKLLASK